MKLIFVTVVASFAFISAGHAKTCTWTGGNDLAKKVVLEVQVTQKTLEISGGTSDFDVNGKWKFKREFSSKDKGSSWLEYTLPKDKSYQGVIDPNLLKAKGTGVLKFWYNNGDGFITTLFKCS